MTRHLFRFTSTLHALPAAVLLALASAGPAGAQGTAHAANVKVASVGEVLRTRAKDDRQVLLRGELYRDLGDAHYEFTDGTGIIGVEIDAALLGHRPVAPGQRVEIQGSVGRDALSTAEIDVQLLRRLD